MAKREALIAARQQAGLTQRQVAELLGIARVSYTRYESGTRTPPLNMAFRIANLFNVNSADLFSTEPCIKEEASRDR